MEQGLAEVKGLFLTPGPAMTPEQQGFELHGSTYTQDFFNTKYYSTTQFALVESVDVEPDC